MEIVRRAGEFVVEHGRSGVDQAGATRLALDSGGSNFADASGLDVSVCHFPPGTSKWNKIEHRLFSQITANWRGRPLVTREAVVELIQATTTRAGLRVRAKLDPRAYVVKKEVTPEQLKRVRIRRAAFRGEWNYTVRSAQKER